MSIAAAIQPFGTINSSQPIFTASAFCSLINAIRTPLYLLQQPQTKQLGLAAASNVTEQTLTDCNILGLLPAIYPEWLGDPAFREIHQLRFCYVGGAMARGIASSDLVISLAKGGMLGFFGSAGLKPERVEQEIQKMKSALDPLGLSYGINLIHSPNQPWLEQKLVELYLQYGIAKVCASAFMALSKNVVWYACKGLQRTEDGQIKRQNYVFAKISRPEVALHFMSPAPEAILQELINEKRITPSEAELARLIPVAEDITVESDSGGHTDNRPLNALFSAIQELRQALTQTYHYQTPIRLGAAGSLGTPAAVAAAFALGAAYVMIGTVHQAAIESGLSMAGKQMLAQADIADVMMAPAADMFEMGVKVQVLRKGSMMGVRGNQLYDLYKRYNALEEIPVTTLEQLEKNFFRATVQQIWEQTKEYFTTVDPVEVDKAEQDAKYKMALIFRWYLGSSSRWPLLGQDDRQIDYQIWCGPAMGAFNRWVKGSFLEKATDRVVLQIALNLLEGAAVITRAHQLRTFGLSVPAEAFNYRPMTLAVD